MLAHLVAWYRRVVCSPERLDDIEAKASVLAARARRESNAMRVFAATRGMIDAESELAAMQDRLLELRAALGETHGL